MTTISSDVARMSEQDIDALEQRVKALRAEKERFKREVLVDVQKSVSKLSTDMDVSQIIEVLANAIAKLRVRRSGKRGRKLTSTVKDKVLAEIAAGKNPAEIIKRHDVSLSYVWQLKKKYHEEQHRQAQINKNTQSRRKI